MPWQRNQNEKSRYKSESREFRVLHDGEDKEREREDEALQLMLALYPLLSPFLPLIFRTPMVNCTMAVRGKEGLPHLEVNANPL